jgi:hypothetical protein
MKRFGQSSHQQSSTTLESTFFQTEDIQSRPCRFVLPVDGCSHIDVEHIRDGDGVDVVGRVVGRCCLVQWDSYRGGQTNRRDGRTTGGGPVGNVRDDVHERGLHPLADLHTSLGACSERAVRCSQRCPTESWRTHRTQSMTCSWGGCLPAGGSHGLPGPQPTSGRVV